MQSYQLKDGDELDEICFRVYGDLPGAIEAVLKANREKLFLVDEEGNIRSLFDDFGRVGELWKPEFILLPDLQRPTEIVKSERIFD